MYISTKYDVTYTGRLNITSQHTMQTGVISFCDRINYNIKSLDTKDAILDELRRRYNIQILQRHWFPLDDNGYSHLERSPHLACLRSNGNPYFMYFTLCDDVPIVYFVDKKVHPTYQKPRIILGRGLWDASLFSNTILDGEMVKDKAGKWVFLINDVLGYKGKNIIHSETLPERLEHAFEMLDELHTPDPVVDCCSYKVKQYARPTAEGVAHLSQLSTTLPYTTRGIYFWPYSAKFKPKLVNFDESLIKAVVRQVKDVPDFRCMDDPPTSTSISMPVPVTESDNRTGQVHTDTNVDDGLTVMQLHKTDNPDVYEVYRDNIKQGLATVPTLKVSKMLRAVFKNATVAMYIPFKCKYVPSSSKWLPCAPA